MNGLENSDIAVLYATPVILADGDKLDSVTKTFRASLGNVENGKVVWKANNGLVEIQGDGTAMIHGAGTEVLTATYNSASRNVTIIIKETDGINTINVSRNTGDDVWRNLSGQAVSTPTHGIYIRNGKKVIVR